VASLLERIPTIWTDARFQYGARSLTAAALLEGFEQLPGDRGEDLDRIADQARAALAAAFDRDEANLRRVLGAAFTGTPVSRFYFAELLRRGLDLVAPDPSRKTDEPPAAPEGKPITAPGGSSAGGNRHPAQVKLRKKGDKIALACELKGRPEYWDTGRKDIAKEVGCHISLLCHPRYRAAEQAAQERARKARVKKGTA
jgi:hypothetical protein